MTTQSTIEQKTKDFIVKTVQNHWDETKNVLMLSTLGVELKKNVPESGEVLREGLSEYLRQNYLVHVVQFPKIFQKVGAVPLSVTVPDDPSPLFKPPRKTAPNDKKPTYKQAFWDSFIEELEAGKVRVITCKPDGELEINDIEESDASENGNTFIVRQDDITKAGVDLSNADKAKATSLKIEDWLKLHTADRKLFLRPLKTNLRPEGASGRLVSLLNAFEGLPESDLARIEIPLDILAKIVKSQ